MPRITTVCPACGVVDLDSDDVTLMVSPLQGTAWYLFDCLVCADQVIKPARGAVITALTRLQVPVLMVPAEALDLARGNNTSLTIDDLLDLLLDLRTTHEAAPLGADVPSTATTSGTAAA